MNVPKLSHLVPRADAEFVKTLCKLRGALRGATPPRSFASTGAGVWAWASRPYHTSMHARKTHLFHGDKTGQKGRPFV